MATKNTTRQVVGKDWETASWYEIFLARARDLAMDRDHTFDYTDFDQITPHRSTREQIVELYETAYSELAESFVGHLEHIEELEAAKTNLNKLLNDQLTFNLDLEERLGSATRQLAGLLLLIEQPVEPPPRRISTDTFQPYQAMHDDD